LNGADITYACATTAVRNLISDNIFANLLKAHHPWENDDFKVPQETIIIKGNFVNLKTNDPKSAMYHKMIQSKWGDDNVQSGNGQNIIQVNPCWKLFHGCPIMISTTDHKKIGAVKGTSAKFDGVKLKQGKSSQIELGNRFKVWSIEAIDVEYILCEHSKKKPKWSSKNFQTPN
jgi:hypothetical protein